MLLIAGLLFVFMLKNVIVQHLFTNCSYSYIVYGTKVDYDVYWKGFLGGG